MSSLNDLVLQIHMTLLNHKDSIDWITSFKDEIAPLKPYEFEKLITTLEGVVMEEQNNFMDTVMHNQIPISLQAKASGPEKLVELIERLKVEYQGWNA